MNVAVVGSAGVQNNYDNHGLSVCELSKKLTLVVKSGLFT